MSETLIAQFEALHAERLKTMDPDKLRNNIEQRRALVEAFDPDAIVKVGDQVEGFTLDLSTGGSVALDDLVADGPVALIFFRFAGCPACNLALPYYDRQLRPALAAAGVRLVAVSPHLASQGLDAIRVRHGLGYEIASDRGNTLARRFGFAFTPQGAPVTASDDPNWIGNLTGLQSSELTQPAVVVIESDRTVSFVDVSPDWLVRTEAPAILASLEKKGRLAA